MSPLGRAPEELLPAAAKGDRVALARLLSMVERGGPASRSLAALAYREPEPYTVGFTGAPGAGKSTLVARLLGTVRPDAQEAGAAGAGQGGGSSPTADLAVLAIDPSSPFTGGAILGDRVRMSDHATDPGVFIRSMATKGHLGGLAVAVPDAVRVLGAVGIPLVLIETVGVGQMEVDVASAADTTVVTVTPGWGDSMQANKAGLLEVADLFVINKADRPGAAEARRDLDQMLDLSTLGDWRPPIVETVAATGEGVAELWSEIRRHRRFLEESGQLEERRRTRLRRELDRILLAMMLEQIEDLSREGAYAGIVERLARGELDPYRAADLLLEPGRR